MNSRPAGWVLAWKLMVSPAEALQWEQYPSTQGDRYFVEGSIRVFVKSQSRVLLDSSIAR